MLKQDSQRDPMSMEIGGGVPRCINGRGVQHRAASCLPRSPQLDRRGAQARRDQRGQGAILAAGHRHGVGDGAARRQCTVLHLRGCARHHRGQPRAGQLLRRQAQEHDARLPDRSFQGRIERRLPRPLRRRHEAHSAEIRRGRPDHAKRHDRRQQSTSRSSRRRNGTSPTAAATSAPEATTSRAIRTTAGSIAAPTG